MRRFFFPALVSLGVLLAFLWRIAPSAVQSGAQATLPPAAPAVSAATPPAHSPVATTPADLLNPESPNSVLPPADESPAPASAFFGTAGPVALAEIPDGPFRASLVALSVMDRTLALQRLARLHVPRSQLTTLRATAGGMLLHLCPPGPALAQIAGAALPDQNEATAAFASAAIPLGAAVPISAPPARSSKPGSKNVLYLDFNGQTVSGTAWNDAYLVPTFRARPYDTDGNTASFSEDEQAVIISIWERVAEDYRAFDINVTTVEPATFTPTTGRVLITLAMDSNGAYVPGGLDAGGVAYLGVFGDSDYVSRGSPAWVIADNLGETNAANIAEAVAHEFGHNLGLSHDGQTSPDKEYYEGHGSGAASWGPIMGASYGRNVTTFSKGEYYHANNTEDDLAIIADRLAYRTDDVADLSATAPVLATGPTTGIIERNDDADRYRITTNGTLSLTLSTYASASGTRGNNLDLLAELLDSSGAVIATYNPTDSPDIDIDVVQPAGSYFLRVRGTGVGSPRIPSPTGYTAYGSIGSYTIVNSTSSNPPPVITLQPVGAARPLGGDYVFTVVSNAPTDTYQWYFNGAVLNRTGARTATLALPSLTFAQAGTYSCVVTNAAGSRPTAAVALAVYRDTPQTFTVNPGASVTFPTLVAGLLDQYRWFRDGVLISTESTPRLVPSGASLRLNKARAGDDAVYTLMASFNGEDIPIGPVTLALRPPVAVSTPATVTVFRGDTPVVPIVSNQDGLVYGYAGLPPGLGYIAATGALYTGTPGPAPGSYPVTLTGTDSYNNKGTTTFTLVILSRTLVVSLPALLPAYRGIDRPVPATVDTAANVTYRYTGLPAGLGYQSATGVLVHVGKTLPAAGSYPVTLTLTDAYGNTGSATFTLVIAAMPASLLVPHAGLLERDAVANQNLGATFSFTPASNGLVTGSLTLGTVRYVLNGRLRGPSDAGFTLDLAATAKNRVTQIVSLALPADGSVATGFLNPASAPRVALRAWPTPYNRKNPAASYSGNYTLGLFTQDAPPEPSAPAGTGSGTFSVAADGRAGWSVRLGDGTLVTGSGALARTGELPVLAAISVVGGSLLGTFAVDPATRALDGDFTWTRLRAPAKTYAKTILYRDGFGPLAVTALGGRYVAPPANTRVLALTGTAAAVRLHFLGGGLSETHLAQLAAPTLTLNAKNVLVTPAAGSNPATLGLSVKAATGAFSGTFILKDPNPLNAKTPLSRKITYQGTLIDGRGVGYYLVPGIKTTAADVPATLAGTVILEPANPEN